MYIRELKIRGFKTYKDETVISFHSGCNCIVGLNGSGKSNILSAIQFLFSDSFGNTLLEKRALLHEGIGSPSSEASVEILLDNVGRRLSMYDEDIVSLKRTFYGPTLKEEWQILGKNVSKKDFDSILESCGISRSNPYFIVRQGKVTELATMSDVSRLRLLKEIAGTRTYDERREESMKLLLETETRKMKVDSAFDDIQKRIEVLKSEQKEFNAFINLDKRRRALEYLLTEFDWEEKSKGEQEYFEKLIKARESLNAVELNITNIKARTQEFSENQKQLETELRELESERKLVQSKISHYSAIIVDLSFEKKAQYDRQKLSDLVLFERDIKRRIEELELTIKDNKEELNQFKVRYSSILKERDLLRKQESDLISKTKELSFSTINERNFVFNKRILEYETEKRNLEIHLNSIREYIDEKSSELNSVNDSISKWEEEFNASQQKLELLLNEIQQDIREKQSLLERKHEISKSLYNKENDMKVIVTQIQDRQRDLDIQIKHSTRRGLDLVREYCRSKNFDWGVEGLSNDIAFNNLLVFGTVMENIKVEDIYITAVEVAAGNNLHNLIVRDSNVASDILSYLKSVKKRGVNEGKHNSSYSIVLSPIDEIKKLNLKYKSRNLVEDGVVSMINVIGFDEKVRPIIEQIFGNYAIVESLETAKLIIEKYGVNCITLDGDEWNSKGFLRGGYRNFNLSTFGKLSSTIFSWNNLRSLVKQKELLDLDISEINNELRILEDRLNELNSKKEDMLNKKQNLMSQISNSKEMVHLCESNARNIQSLMAKISEEEERAVGNIDIVQGYIVTLKRAVESKTLSKGLTNDEELRMREIIEKVKNLEHFEIPDMEERLSILSNNIEKQEVHLNTLYKDYYRSQQEKREESIMLAEDDIDVQSSLLDYKRTLEESNNLLIDINKRLELKRQQIVQIDLQREKISQEEQSMLKEHEELEALIGNLQKKYESYKHAKELVLLERTKQVCYPNIGSDICLPKERTKVYHELQRIKKKISEDFKVVNRKAISELDQFVREYTDLSDRHKELDSAMSSIQKLIETLDIQKERTLLKTFEEINFYFNQVFKELIPFGDAKLVLKLSNEKKGEKENININGINSTSAAKIQKNSENKDLKIIDNEEDSAILGIGIRVSFNVGNKSHIASVGPNQKNTNVTGSYYSLSQLSGGQKTLVALALLFSIHRADPAPMYLLDEIDAALDDQYRWSVANLIQKQSASTQFILTTFRPQMLEIANKYFQVFQVNRSSFVKEISKEQAMELQQEQNQQKITVVSTDDRG